jgi:hypothetical protein
VTALLHLIGSAHPLSYREQMVNNSSMIVAMESDMILFEGPTLMGIAAIISSVSGLVMAFRTARTRHDGRVAEDTQEKPPGSERLPLSGPG